MCECVCVSTYVCVCVCVSKLQVWMFGGPIFACTNLHSYNRMYILMKATGSRKMILILTAIRSGQRILFIRAQRSFLEQKFLWMKCRPEVYECVWRLKIWEMKNLYTNNCVNNNISGKNLLVRACFLQVIIHWWKTEGSAKKLFSAPFLFSLLFAH